MSLAGGSQEKGRGIDRAAGRDDDVAGVAFEAAVATYDDGADVPSGAARLEPFDVCACQQTCASDLAWIKQG